MAGYFRPVARTATATRTVLRNRGVSAPAPAPAPTPAPVLEPASAPAPSVDVEETTVSSAESAAPAPAPSDNGITEGTIAQVLERVRSSPALLPVALAEESNKERPRYSLIRQLNEMHETV